jgi:hypothetical protein
VPPKRKEKKKVYFQFLSSIHAISGIHFSFTYAVLRVKFKQQENTSSIYSCGYRWWCYESFHGSRWLLVSFFFCLKGFLSYTVGVLINSFFIGMLEKDYFIIF